MAFNQNKIFYYGAFLFSLLALLFLATDKHGVGILWFANHRTSFTDIFFTYATKIGEEWSYVLLLFLLLFYKFREAILVFALAILVPTISLTLKSLFARPRPKQYFQDLEIFDTIHLVDGVELYSANTSFPSGHTISAFAVLGFAAFAYRHNKMVSILMIFLAILVAISRVYLVQHFLIDVSAGAIIGSAIACLVSWMSIRIDKLKLGWGDKNLRTFRKTKVKV